jgi:hypothetical protein
MATDSWIAQLGRRWEERGHDSPAERKSQEAGSQSMEGTGDYERKDDVERSKRM